RRCGSGRRRCGPGGPRPGASGGRPCPPRLPSPGPIDKSDLRMLIRTHEYPIQGGRFMEFGIFSQMHGPPWDDEHSRYLRELEVPSAAETKPMWRESLEQIPRMWRDEPYAFEGRYFRMPERNVLPKPYSKPHPPIWVACSSPPTFIEAGELGLGSLCFTFGTPAEI